MIIVKTTREKPLKQTIVDFSVLSPYVSNNDEIAELRSSLIKLEELVLLIAKRTNDKVIWEAFAAAASSWREKYEIRD